MTLPKPSAANHIYAMAAVGDEAIGEVVCETLVLAQQPVLIARPQSPDLLLDLNEVAAAYKQDEYMPYWATLWPVAKYLAAAILSRPWPEPCRALELGCGLGLPGVAALLRGVEVIFSDYDATALRFAAENARLNGFAGVETLLLDWRCPQATTFDLIIASDLLYERRNIAPLIASFSTMLTPRGTVMLADQNRPYADEFRAAVRAAGFRLKATAVAAGPDAEVAGTVYELSRLECSDLSAEPG